METVRSKNGLAYAAIGIAIVAIAISVAMAAMPKQQAQQESNPTPQTRDFYLFTQVDADLESQEDALGVPPDMFSLKEMTVNKGDTVRVHFYNLEPVAEQEHHTFTMADPYQTNVDLNAGENREFEFVASESGVFEYQCIFHSPTMRGQLVVLGDS